MHSAIQSGSRAPHRERGVTLVLVSILILAFFVIAALAVDVGIAYSARTSAQHAADSAALAGAYALVNAASEARIATAFSDAKAIAGTYSIFGVPVNITNTSESDSACDASLQSMICVDDTKRRVSAVVAVPVQTYFGRILTDLLNVRVVAHAEAAKNAAGDSCLKPIFISNDAIYDDPTGTYNNMVANAQGDKEQQAAYKARCNAASNSAHTIFDVTGTTPGSTTPDLPRTQYADQYIAAQASKSSWISNAAGCTGAGCPILLLNDASSPNPSQTGLVDLTPTSQDNSTVDGNALVACAMGGCYQECATEKQIYHCGDPSIGLKTGVSTGQVAPLDTFIGGSGTDHYIDVGQYSTSWGTSQDSRAVVSVVVWDCRLDQPNGTKPSPGVLGIAKVFINKTGSGANAFLVGAGSCGSGSASGPGAIPVRLVNK